MRPPILRLLLLGVAIFFPGSRAPATVLTFDPNAEDLSPLSQAYGDRVGAASQGGFEYGAGAEGFTPRITVSYRSGGGSLLLWTIDYGDLQNVLVNNADFNSFVEITLTADPGHRVRLVSWDMGGWPRRDWEIARLAVLDGPGGVALGFDRSQVPIEGNAGHSTFELPQPIEAPVVTLRFDTGLGPRNDNVGIDNVRFAQVPESPLVLTTTSSGAAHAQPIAGDLAAQIGAANAPPPPFDPLTWSPVARRSLHGVGVDSFRCDAQPPIVPLEQGFVAADVHLPVDEVTFDNCSSAFYRFTFTLPAQYASPVLSGVANVDDEAVLWLNGRRVSASLRDPFLGGSAACAAFDPSDPAAPCFGEQDAGADRSDAEGRRALTAPTRDPFFTRDPALFRPGENELVLSVVGDASYFEPTGLEFQATVGYRAPGPDADGDGVEDVDDNCPHRANPGQLDSGGVGSGSGSDGIGDACQCGDHNGDGRVTLADAAALQRSFLVPPTAPRSDALCDVGASDGCSLADAVVIRRALLVPPTLSIEGRCEAAQP